MSAFIDRFHVILLDMGHTFLFDCDRFGQDQDYHETYRSLGGVALDSHRVTAAIGSIFAAMMADQINPVCYDNYRTVAEHLQSNDESRILPLSEQHLLEAVFARHEAGAIPPLHAKAIHALSRSHPLGVISNIFSNSTLYVEEFARAGVLDLFDHIVWSSQHGCIKPSPRLFHIALERFGLSAAQAVYVGDNPKRDIAAAKSLGMGAVWIRNEQRPLSPGDASPDLVIDHLADLPDARVAE